MGSEWPEISLNDVCLGIYDCPHSTPKLSDSGPYMVRTQDIRQGYFDTNSAVYVNEEVYTDRTRRAEPRYGDLLFSREGTYFGDAAEVPLDTRVCLGQRMVLIRPKTEIIRPRYLRMLINSPAFQAMLMQYRDGTVAERLNLSVIRSLLITVPSLGEQDYIVENISCIEEKMHVNRQMNETLESMAQALFKSWFVDFDPVIDNALASGKEIPEELREKAQARSALGDKRQPLPAEIRTLFPDEFVYSDEQEWIPKQWGTSPLGDEIDFATGPAFKSKDFSAQGIKLARGMNVKEGHFKWGENTRYWSEISEDMKKHELKSGDVLIGMDGSKVGKNWVRVSFSDLPCLLVQRVARLRPKNTVGSTFLEVLIGGGMFKRYVENVKTGTTILHISGGQIKNYPIVNPCDEGVLFREFESMLGATAKKREENLAQTNTLIKLRDTLLPKLLSGKIRIPDAEKMVEELTL